MDTADENNFLTKSEERMARVERALKKKNQQVVFFVGAGIIVIAALVWFGIRLGRKAGGDGPGEYYPDNGQTHISLQTPPSTYSSNPPSSGPHYFDPANWGIYDYEVDDRIFIHNLEHGGIWIAYDPLAPQGAKDSLRAIVGEFNGVKVVMAPRQKKTEQDKDIAAVAWRRVYKFNLNGNGNLTEEQKNNIRAFYKKFVNRGPEAAPATMSGIDPKTVQSASLPEQQLSK